MDKKAANGDADQTRAGKILRRLGFERKQLRENGQRGWFFVREENPVIDAWSDQLANDAIYTSKGEINDHTK